MFHCTFINQKTQLIFWKWFLDTTHCTMNANVILFLDLQVIIWWGKWNAWIIIWWLPDDLISFVRYLWNVTMTKGKRTSSATVITEVVDNQTPLIIMETNDITLNYGEALRISSLISTYNMKPVKIYWDCSNAKGF